MIDPSLAIQAALVATLKGNTDVNGAVGGRVYDAVPTAPTFPYISLGDMQVLPDKEECIDASEVFMQIDVWSRTNGYPEVKRIGAAVAAALDDQPVAIDGFRTIIFEIQNTQYLRDPDGMTRHAALSFRALVQPTT